MKMNKIILLVSICILLLTSCDFASGEGDETLSADQVLTYVAETVNASFSLTPPATDTSTPTFTATATGTPTPSPSATSTFTVISNEGTGGNTGGNPSGCDNATFVSDVTIPDGTQFAPGTAFTKTWRIQNSGTCAWTTAYSVFFLKGETMSGVSPLVLASDTPTGSTRDISLELVAPATAGTYTGYWQLKNAAGQPFGHNFYVQIVVSGDTLTPTATATGATATPTNTGAPTATFTDTSVPAATSTDTPVPAPTNTNTSVPTATDTAVPTSTYTTAPTATDTPTP